MDNDAHQSSGTTQHQQAPSSLSNIHGRIHKLQASIWNAYNKKPIHHWILLLLSSLAMLVAFPASTLLSRLYYSNGGTSRWILSWVAVAGWPLTSLFLLPLYLRPNISPTPLSLKLSLSYIGLGFLSAADNLMFAWAFSYLPASTASLLSSTSLAFSAIFGYLLVKNKLNLSTINSIVIIMAGAVIIALDSSSDRPPGVSKGQYALGFLWDILGSALHGLIFALSELVFVKLMGRRSFHVVLEQQVMVSFFGFVFTTIGVVLNNDFKAMRKAARTFKNGEVSYIMVLLWGAITFQLGVLGGTAVLFLTSTVMAGVLNAVRVPLTSVAAVVVFHDPMSGFKILSLVLTVWGFGCYIYGNSPETKSS
ncbi:probable purine permease 5 isoform X2 [Amborella trichopoda]|uniref:probable purine permease 5 isoform X2 n=1 Tax=Amborella trichopoda TaxID=13333 RepID=UPI0009C0D9E1|nr:probable purine permease 5 isoform X2 [Amborella trichopoda]|eukprot:XP_020530891.1 probable purine permease 5 isoform X2 [Amborella trichopoda]